MPDDFVPMRAWLQPPPLLREEAVAEEAEILDESFDVEEEASDPIRNAMRFQAALEDALTYCLDALLTDLSSDVLARELQLKPCDMARVVKSALARYDAEPVSIRVHSADAAALESYPIRIDDTLRRGDAVIELHCGTIDAKLGTRLERVLSERSA
jgi:flagellar biosynthesis/type III secretory pathway protein FliH